MKKWYCLILFVILVGYPVFSYPPMQINDSGVRLREEPGLEGNIIRILHKGEKVFMISCRGFEPDEYEWVKVQTESDQGWVYGKYISLVEETRPLRFNTIDDASIRVGEKCIFIGMTESDLIETLGAPMSRLSDEESGEEMFFYGGYNELTINTSYDRIDYIKIETTTHSMSNGITVGTRIEDIIAANDSDLLDHRYYLYSFGIPNYFKSSVYNCSVVFRITIGGYVATIEVGGSS